MSDRRPTTSWLQKTINKDYSDIVHELVMGLFKDRWPVLGKTTGRKGTDSASATTDEGFPLSSVSVGDESDNDYVSGEFSSSSSGRESVVKSSSEGFDEACSEDIIEDNAYGFSWPSREEDKEATSESGSSLDSAKDSVAFRGSETFRCDCCDDCSPDDAGSDHSDALTDRTLTPRNGLCDVPADEKERDEDLQLSILSEEISGLVSLGSFAAQSKEAIEEHVQYEDTIRKIYAQDTKIRLLEASLDIGARSRGYIGSIPHLQTAKNLVLAKLTERALTESLARRHYFPPSRRVNFPKGKVTVRDIQCDTNKIGEQNELLPCYYMVAIQLGLTVLYTNIQAVNCYGMIEFHNHMVFDDVSHDFTMRMFLYKLSFAAQSKAWKGPFSMKLKSKAPRFQMIGEREITMANIRQTAFSFDNEVVYTNFLLSIDTKREFVRGGIILGKIVRKNKLQTKMVVSDRRWAVLEGTDLKIYESPLHTRDSKAIEVLRMTQCRSCRPHLGFPNALVLNMARAQSSADIYLIADNRHKFRQWLRSLNSAILVTKKWDSLI